MNIVRLGVVLAISLFAPGVRAQASAPPGRSAPPARGPEVLEAPAPDPRPIRARRPFAIGGEVGWNGLSGLGVNFSYHPIPYLALDAGAGLGMGGWKGGLRLRANFLTSAWTPVVGAGFLYEAGSGGQAVEFSTGGDTAKIEVLPSSYVQMVAGVNYTGDEGFVFMATAGYAILLEENTRFVSGSRDAYDDFRPFLAGGVVLSAALGFAF